MKKTLLERWTTFDKLCLISAMVKLKHTIGDQNWVAISRNARHVSETIGSLMEYDKRSEEWFSARQCAAQYEQIVKGGGPRRKKRGERSDSLEALENLQSQLARDLREEIQRDLNDIRRSYARSQQIVDDIDHGRYNEEELEVLLDSADDDENGILDIKSRLKSMLDEKKADIENSTKSNHTSHHSVLPIDLPPPPPPQPTPTPPPNEIRTCSTTSPLLTSLLQSPSPLVRSSMPSTSSPTISLLLNSSPPVPIIDSTLSKLLETPSMPSSSSSSFSLPTLHQQKSLVFKNGVVESEIVIEQNESPAPKKNNNRTIHLEVESEETEEEVLETVEEIIERVEEAIIETVGENNLDLENELNQSDGAITIDSDLGQLEIGQDETVEVIVLNDDGTNILTCSDTVILDDAPIVIEDDSPVKIPNDAIIIQDPHLKINDNTSIVIDPSNMKRKKSPLQLETNETLVIHNAPTHTVILDDSPVKICNDTIVLDDSPVKLNNETVILDESSIKINDTIIIDDDSPANLSSDTIVLNESPANANNDSDSNTIILENSPVKENVKDIAMEKPQISTSGSVVIEEPVKIHEDTDNLVQSPLKETGSLPEPLVKITNETPIFPESPAKDANYIDNLLESPAKNICESTFISESQMTNNETSFHESPVQIIKETTVENSSKSQVMELSENISNLSPDVAQVPLESVDKNILTGQSPKSASNSVVFSEPPPIAVADSLQTFLEIPDSVMSLLEKQEITKRDIEAFSEVFETIGSLEDSGESEALEDRNKVNENNATCVKESGHTYEINMGTEITNAGSAFCENTDVNNDNLKMHPDTTAGPSMSKIDILKEEVKKDLLKMSSDTYTEEDKERTAKRMADLGAYYLEQNKDHKIPECCLSPAMSTWVNQSNGKSSVTNKITRGTGTHDSPRPRVEIIRFEEEPKFDMEELRKANDKTMKELEKVVGESFFQRVAEESERIFMEICERRMKFKETEKKQNPSENSSTMENLSLKKIDKEKEMECEKTLENELKEKEMECEKTHENELKEKEMECEKTLENELKEKEMECEKTLENELKEKEMECEKTLENELKEKEMECEKALENELKEKEMECEKTLGNELKEKEMECEKTLENELKEKEMECEKILENELKEKEMECEKTLENELKENQKIEDEKIPEHLVKEIERLDETKKLDYSPQSPTGLSESSLSAQEKTVKEKEEPNRKVPFVKLKRIQIGADNVYKEQKRSTRQEKKHSDVIKDIQEKAEPEEENKTKKVISKSIFEKNKKVDEKKSSEKVLKVILKKCSDPNMDKPIAKANQDEPKVLLGKGEPRVVLTKCSDPNIGDGRVEPMAKVSKSEPRVVLKKCLDQGLNKSTTKFTQGEPRVVLTKCSDPKNKNTVPITLGSPRVVLTKCSDPNIDKSVVKVSHDECSRDFDPATSTAEWGSKEAISGFIKDLKRVCVTDKEFYLKELEEEQEQKKREEKKRREEEKQSRELQQESYTSSSDGDSVKSEKSRRSRKKKQYRRARNRDESDSDDSSRENKSSSGTPTEISSSSIGIDDDSSTGKGTTSSLSSDSDDYEEYSRRLDTHTGVCSPLKKKEEAYRAVITQCFNDVRTQADNLVKTDDDDDDDDEKYYKRKPKPRGKSKVKPKDKTVNTSRSTKKRSEISKPTRQLRASRTSAVTNIDSKPDSPSLSIASSDDDKDLRAWRKSIMLVYNRLASHKFASVFSKPITESEAPGYHDVVLRPMDLSTVKRNIEAGTIRTTVEFQRDMILMVQNAIMYNKNDTPYYDMALQMGKDMLAEMEIMVQALGDGVPLLEDINDEKQKPRGRSLKAGDSSKKRKMVFSEEGRAAKRKRTSSS